MKSPRKTEALLRSSLCWGEDGGRADLFLAVLVFKSLHSGRPFSLLVPRQNERSPSPSID